MTQPPLWLPLLVVGAGLSFALTGVAYKLAFVRGIPLAQIGLFISVAGCFFFAIRVGPEKLAGVPPHILAVGAAVGASQYVVNLLFKYALRHGPLSPMWCAGNLGFLAPVVYSIFWLNEPTPLCHALGVLMGVACVVFAAFAEEAGSSSRRTELPDKLLRRVVYGMELFLILFFSGLSNLALKYLMARPAAPGVSEMDRYGDSYLFWFYAGFGAVLLGDVLASRGPTLLRKGTVRLGGMAAAGSVLGMWALSRCSPLPSAFVFAGYSIVSILAIAVIGMLAFGEKRTPAWYGTVGSAVLSVVLVSLS